GRRLPGPGRTRDRPLSGRPAGPAVSRTSRHRVDVRAYAVGPGVAGRGVPVGRPGHRAADARPGGAGVPAAAAGVLGEAVQRVVDPGRADVAGARGAGGRRGADADLRRRQAGLDGGAGQRGDEVHRALTVHAAVTAVHRTAVVVLRVDDGQDVLDLQRGGQV